jgi:hypothetical protein
MEGFDPVSRVRPRQCCQGCWSLVGFRWPLVPWRLWGGTWLSDEEETIESKDCDSESLHRAVAKATARAKNTPSTIQEIHFA